MSNTNYETVLSVRHWTDGLFSFRTTRDPGFRFRSGQFTMIGLEIEGKPLLRAYSVASAHYEDELEFFSIKVPNGPLTSHLASIKEGDRIIIGRKPVGTLLLDNIKPGKRLFLLATGTGLAPFLSIIKDPEAYEKFEQVVLVHGVRQVRDLAYADYIENGLPNDEFLGEIVREQLVYVPTVTREPFRNQGRLTDLLTQGRLEGEHGHKAPAPDFANDRFMLCGSEAMNKDVIAILKEKGCTEGNNAEPGDFVVEKAFVEK